MLVAGIMSGTSVDGIDVALVEISGQSLSLRVNLVGFHEASFPDGIREELLGVSDATVATARVSQLNFLLGRIFGAAVLEACDRTGVAPCDLDLIGSHGQTIYHQAEPSRLCGFQVSSTLQIGEPACIAAVVGRPVVADFRPGDMAAGGQGAPLVPFVDYLLFGHPTINRVTLNIGGIANVTAIPAGKGPEAVFAFDTGPGNMVVDQLIERLTDGAERFDRDGRTAAKGVPDNSLIEELLEDPYYRQPPPKSTGRERYGAGFVSALRERGLPPESLVATAAHLTAQTILHAIHRFVRPAMPVDELVVSGGGWWNPAIVQPLIDGLVSTRVRSSNDYGIPGDAKEAVAFAVLAYETYHGRPANLPSATGASRRAILGKIVPAWPGGSS